MKAGKSIFTRAGLSVWIISVLLTPSVISGAVQDVKSTSGRITFDILIEQPTLVETGDNTIRISIEGYGTFSPPGAVEIPGRIFNVAVPQKGRPTVTASILSRERLGSIELGRKRGSRLRRGDDDKPVTETYLPDEDPWKGKGLPPVVSAGKKSIMGRVTVVPVRVNPVGLDSEGYWVARKIRVTVNYPPADRADSGTVSKKWKGIYERVLVNPEDASGFSKEIARPRNLIRGTNNGGRSARIRIPETGLYVIEADSLNNVMTGGPMIMGQFALKRYYYDESEPDLQRELNIPMKIIKGENSSAEYFEEDDLLYFHVKGLRDDPAAGDTIAAFTGDHVVWLKEDQFGEMMTEGGGREAAGEPADHSFTSVVRVRKDTFYKKKIRSGIRDFYYVAVPEIRSVSSPFYCRDILPGGEFAVKVSLRGFYESDDKNLTFKIQNSNGTSEIGYATLSGENAGTFIFSSLSSDDLLVSGENNLVISSQNSDYPVLINHFSVEYSRIMNMRDGMLEFSVENPVDSIRVTGFGSPGGYLANVTGDTGHTVYPLAPELFTDTGDGYTLAIRLSPEDTGRLVLFEKGAGRHIYNRWITQDVTSDIKSRTGPYNTLVIAHGDFLPPESDDLSEYVSWREQQGYSILTADVQDVYDEFNGGLPSCSAIKRFIEYGYNNWGVEFVLLVGDASEDHKRLYSGPSGSAPDFVPSYTYSMRMDAVGYDDEVIATDKWYAFIDDELPFDSPAAEPVIDAVRQRVSDIQMPSALYPDIFVGRVPVSDDIEARRVFLKLRRYEEETANGEWRRNLILFADDAWSGGPPSYTYHPSEENFKGSMETIAGQLETAYPSGVNIRKLYLSKWTDGVKPHNSNAEDRSIAIDSTRQYFTPYLIDRLNEGALFFAFQGHASRSHMSTEAGFSMFVQYSDVGELYSNRNHIYIGMGCHISEFALLMELGKTSFCGPGGDCITEQMMIRSGAGAVGAYASTAYEDLIKNNRMCETIFDVIYNSPPSDSAPPDYNETRARWIMGEIFTEAEIEHINRRTYGTEQSFRHVLFGDPMMNIDSGPPMMNVRADWGNGWEEIPDDTLVSRNSANICDLRFTANDFIALGGVGLSIRGDDWTDSLEVTPIRDAGLTYARGYRADLKNYRLSLDDSELLFTVYSPEGRELGNKTLHRGEAGVRLFYIHNGEEVEIKGNTELLEGLDFRLEVNFPIYLQSPPTVSIDGSEFSDIDMVPVQGDSALWEGYFSRAFSPGEHTITVSYGDFSSRIQFVFGSGEFTFDTFCFPNPFSSGTNIFFTLERRMERGRIKIYNVSGTLIRELDIPSGRLVASAFDDPGSVYWDGMDMAGNRVANGTYIYLIRLNLPGETVSLDGRIVKLE